MAQVRWTEEAARWLREIHDYIAQDSPQTAQPVVREIHARGESLAAFPERGYHYHARVDRDIRILLWGHIGNRTFGSTLPVWSCPDFADTAKGLRMGQEVFEDGFETTSLQRRVQA